MTASRSAVLLESAFAELDQAASRRLMKEIASGGIQQSVFVDYLAAEAAFVRTAARFVGYCIYSETDWDRANAHIGSLMSLVTEQRSFFEAELPETDGLFETVDTALGGFVQGQIENHGYPAAIVSMFAAETLYLRWCSEALATGSDTVAERGTAAQRWLDMHVTEKFRNQVALYAAIVDDIPHSISDAELTIWFIEMLAAENRFHDLPYARTDAR